MIPIQKNQSPVELICAMRESLWPLSSLSADSHSTSYNLMIAQWPMLLVRIFVLVLQALFDLRLLAK